MIIKLSKPTEHATYLEGEKFVNHNLRKVSLYYKGAALQYNKSIFYFILNQVNSDDKKTVYEACKQLGIVSVASSGRLVKVPFTDKEVYINKY